jgi:hypothetical protein
MPETSEIVWRQAVRAAPLAVLIALCACAPTSTDIASHSDPAQQAAVSGHSDPQICRPARTLLVPPHAPDCSFDRAELKTLDPDEWARLKVEYERKCYQTAERTVRETLRLLQAANRCEAGATRS